MGIIPLNLTGLVRIKIKKASSMCDLPGSE